MILYSEKIFFKTIQSKYFMEGTQDLTKVPHKDDNFSKS